MSLNKKLLAASIAGLLLSANASAVTLGTDPARVYASEIVDGTALVDPADIVSFEIGYNFSDGEVRYGRFECTSNLTMDNVNVSTASADITLGAINGEGTSALFFSMTAGAAPGVTADDVIDVDADNTLEDGGAVNCAFSIYDQPSQAQAGGADGRIYTTGFEPFIVRESGFIFEMDPTGITQAVADVEDSNGPYFGFVGGDQRFGNLTFQAVPGVLNINGVQIVLADIFDTDSTVTVQGDYTAAADTGDDATFSFAIDMQDDVATYEAFDTEGVGTFYYFETGTDAIAESGYTATLHPVVNTGYAVDEVGPIHVGEIVRNGTQLQAPLVQVPGNGWLSRMVLTNTGGLDRMYEISVLGEDGNTIGTANTTGIVPANGTVVIDLTSVLTSFTAGKQHRGTLNVTVAAPNNQIQGLYQIVNSAAGSLSNHVMVRPGTN